MIKRLLFVAAILIVSTSIQASPYNQWWDAGNRFYKQKQYDSAAIYFEKVAALKPQDEAVYYNLGNTYYRLNEIGLAVLNYERALKIAPGNKLAQDNLALTQSRIAKRIPEVEDIFFVQWWQSITAPGTTTLWSVLSLLFFLSIIAIALLRMYKKIQMSNNRLQFVLGAVWVVTLILAFSSAMNKTHESAVVTQNGVNLMSGGRQNKPTGSVPEGTKVDIEQQEAGMVEVTLPDGRKGWIDKTAITKI